MSEPSTRAGWRVPVGRVLGALIILGAVATGFWVWRLTYVDPRTDDASVRANVVGIAPHVAGPLVELHVVDNQPVVEGDLLFVIDPRPYQARLDRARAVLRLTTREVQAQGSAVASAGSEITRRQADQAAAEAALAQAETGPVVIDAEIARLEAELAAAQARLGADLAYAEDYLKRVEPLLALEFVTVDRVQEARSKQRALAAAVQEAERRERAAASAVVEADAGASLKRSLERLLGTIAGGIAGLLAIIAFIDLPYVFAPALGLAVVAGVYLSHVMAAPYPPLLGVMTYVLVTLSHVEFPEDYVDVALWRVAAIGMGVVLGTGAQLFLWPDDPIDKLRAGLARRLYLVRSLVDQAIAPPATAPARPSAAMLTLGDLTTELQLLANAEVLHGYLRARHAEHTALILEVARLFTSALWAGETTPATTARVGLDDTVRVRLLAISEESARLARALESRRGLLGSTGPTAIIPAEAGTGPAVSAQAPVLNGMERSLGRIAFLTGAPRPDGASRSDGQRMTELTPAVLWAIDVSEPTTAGSWSLRSWSPDTAALKLGLKAALGLELCYLVMLGLDWPGLVTSAVTCVIIAQTTVGATLSKAVLRQVGAVLGGVLGLIAIVVFMPNLHDLTSFLVVLGAGYLVAAWITVGGPRTAYAGIQTALALGIVLLSGFGPTTELVGARDRVLGILLGAAVMGVIDRVLWPVQARRAMRPTLARALRLMAELARVGARRGDGQLADHPKGLRTKIYRLLSATLAYRDQSRMEGDPDTPEARAESDMILHFVTDAQALLPGLFAAAGERLAAEAPAPRTALAGHVEEFERTIADLLVATADSLEGGAAQGLAELRARARQLGEGVDAEPWTVPVDAAGDDAGARLESRHVTSHQLLRLVTRLAPDP